MRPKKSKNNRARQGRIVVGVHSCLEALKVRQKDVRQIWLRKDWERSDELKAVHALAKSRKIDLSERPQGFFEEFSSVHQGVALEVTTDPEWDESEIDRLDETDTYILMALDEVTDPHNLGAVLRTSWLMGAKAILIPEHRSAPLSPTACKVASGGAEHVPVVSGQLPNQLSDLKEKGFWIYGLDMGGKQNLWQTKFPEKVVLVIGAEGKGIRQSVKNCCDEIISIPQADPEASLNASVAAGISLSEVVRQHQID